MKGKNALAAAKSMLGTNIGTSNTVEGNPPPTVAAWLASSGGVELKAVKTAGSTTPAEDGRPIKLMVAAAAGLPDTFFGDADVGNFATSETLDRPTELKMVARQKFWSSIFMRILDMVILCSCKASRGKLKEKGASVSWELDKSDDTKTLIYAVPENTDKKFGEVGKPINSEITITFPSILERNATERVRSTIGALTLNGKPPTALIQDRRLMTRYLLQAIGAEDIEGILDTLYPPGQDMKPIKDPFPAPPKGTTGSRSKGEKSNA